jgi:anti-anti-sigma factor
MVIDHPDDDPSSATPDDRGLATRPQQQFDSVLAARSLFRQAQGALAQRSGGSLARAGHVLLHFGAELELPDAEAAAAFFLACTAPGQADPRTQQLIARITAAAAPPSTRHGDHAPGAANREHASADQVRHAAHTDLLSNGLGVGVHGDLDLASAPHLAAAIEEYGLCAAAGDSVVFDLHDLTFCDVSGVRALADAHASVTSNGGRVYVVPPAAGSPHRMLQLAVSRGWLTEEFTPELPPENRGDPA